MTNLIILQKYMSQTKYWIYFILLYIISISLVYVLIHNKIQGENFTPTIRRSYNSNARFMRNSIYGTYKKAIHRATNVLKFLRLY
jgi:hypothetical protein